MDNLLLDIHYVYIYIHTCIYIYIYTNNNYSNDNSNDNEHHDDNIAWPSLEGEASVTRAGGVYTTSEVNPRLAKRVLFLNPKP